MPKTTYTNRLINQKSPYLLQHAHNPVDWYPWGDEAFEKAKAYDKPVFLSIGYSTCHWCHVMERESFEDEEVADILNSNFISIKVDREERPDVDNFYMNTTVALTGSGGWPLSCFLTPDRKVFFAGTYFPKKDGLYGTGFISILKSIIDIWHTRRDEIITSSNEILQYIDRPVRKSTLNENADTAAFKQLAQNFDHDYGGFGAAPKFPTLQNIMFLMQYCVAYNDKSALEYVKKTLNSMMSGGIYDHIGGGFCRYSTDDKWLIPHFEKMMYDNAMHIMTYAQAGVLIDETYFDIVRGVINFCIRDMLHPSGGFFAALDADSEGVEGKYYVFTPDEIYDALGNEDGKKYCRLFDITEEGNFEGKNIPNLINRSPSDEDKNFAKNVNSKLLKYREKRIPPFRDEKIMSSINGLMIASLAQAGYIMSEKNYIGYAERCAAFVMENLFRNERLQSYWKEGLADIPASSEDYAYIIWGLIELYEATFKPEWLEKALHLTRSMDELFWDKSGGGYFISGSDADDLPSRQKNLHDGALPSGNSIAAINLLRLSRLCSEPIFEQKANDIINLMASGINSYPSSCCGILCANLYLKSKGSEVIFVNGEGIEKMINALPRYSPFNVTLLCGKGYEKATEVAPYLSEYRAIEGKATAYLCKGGSCMQPVTGTYEFTKLIQTNI